jgi:hypothetical protein
MGWARARRRLTGWLALMTLALQLAVSFGHIHSEDVAAPDAAGITQLSAADGAPDGHRDSDHSNCGICATVHLAGTLLPPAPPTLALFASFVAAAFDAALPDAPTAIAAAAFHARGPPHA